MKVSFVCASYKPIQIKTTGGIEIFAIYLLNALKKLGVDITLYAASETDTSLFPGIKFMPTFSSFNDLAKEENVIDHKRFALNYSMFQLASLNKAYVNDNFDILHFSCAQWYLPFLLPIKKNNRIVTTIHTNDLREKPLKYLLREFNGPYITNISQSSGSAFSQVVKRKIIYNGIELVSFPFNDKPDNYFFWLGRIFPTKGLKEALQSAHKADVDFIASGPNDKYDYFNNEVKPLLDDKRRLIGPLDFKNKGEYLSKAKAVLMPVMWEEPFGLVAIEAMACGTPVIAFRKGGLKETVIDGVTGFLVDTVDEMADKMKIIDKIDRRKCREHVEKNFSSTVMAKNYLNYYQEIIKSDL